MSNNKQSSNHIPDVGEKVSSIEWLIEQLPDDYKMSLPYELVEKAQEIYQKQIIDFALYHSAIMKYALQNDCEFYAKQNYKLWLQGKITKQEIEKQLKQAKKQAKAIHKEESFKIFKAGQDSMEEGGKGFNEWYNEIFNNN